MSIPKKSRNLNQSSIYTQQRPVTYRELRQMEKLNQTANVGPGAYHDERPTSSKIKTNVSFGSKYKFKPKEGPAPGQYDFASGQNYLKPKIRTVTIDAKCAKLGVSPGKEIGNDPGKYDKHLTPFGANIKTRVSMGSKHKF